MSPFLDIFNVIRTQRPVCFSMFMAQVINIYLVATCLFIAYFLIFIMIVHSIKWNKNITMLSYNELHLKKTITIMFLPYFFITSIIQGRFKTRLTVSYLAPLRITKKNKRNLTLTGATGGRPTTHIPDKNQYTRNFLECSLLSRAKSPNNHHNRTITFKILKLKKINRILAGSGPPTRRG